MKFNLKNRPPTILGINQAKWVNPEKTALWFKGFEKELRERKTHWERLIRPDDCYHKMYTINFAKEILGE